MTATSTLDDLQGAVAEARAEVLASRQVLDEWQQKRDAAAAELEDLEERLGDLLLEAPDSEDELVERMTRLRGRIASAEKAIRAQEPNVLVAASAYLTAEAEALVPEIVALADQEAKHAEKVTKLLGQLEALEGCRYIPHMDLVVELNRPIQAGTVNGALQGYTAPKSRESANKQKRKKLEVQVEILREIAAGRSVAQLVNSGPWSAEEILPSCVYGPDALVPVREYIPLLRRLEEEICGLEETAARLEREIAEFERKEREASSGSTVPERSWLGAIDRRRIQAAGVGDRLEQTRAALAAIER